MINSVQSTDVNFGSRYCYIPKCKARCCSSAPLPTSLVTFSKLREKQIRRVFFTIPAPNNNPYCRHSVIPVQSLLITIFLKLEKQKTGKKYLN